MECTTNRYKHAYAHTDKEMHYFHIRLYAWVAFNGHLTKMEESNTHAFLCSAFFYGWLPMNISLRFVCVRIFWGKAKANTTAQPHEQWMNDLFVKSNSNAHSNSIWAHRTMTECRASAMTKIRYRINDRHMTFVVRMSNYATWFPTY